MVSKKSVVAKIRKDWGVSPQSEICTSVLTYVTSTSMPLSHVTYGSIREVVGKHFSDQDIFSSLEYLCGDSVHLLEIGFELIEDENYIPVDIQAIQNARKTGELIHPDTGESIAEYEKKIYVYFQASQLSQDIEA